MSLYTGRVATLSGACSAVNIVGVRLVDLRLAVLCWNPIHSGVVLNFLRCFLMSFWNDFSMSGEAEFLRLVVSDVMKYR